MKCKYGFKLQWRITYFNFYCHWMWFNFPTNGIPIGIVNSLVGLKIYAIPTEIKRYNSIIKKKNKKKHNIVSKKHRKKLNIIEVLIYKV